MAKSKVVWLDKSGRQHETEVLADKADERFVIMDAFATAGIEIGSHDLERLEDYNEAYIKPFKEYFDRLHTEAVARERRTPSC